MYSSDILQKMWHLVSFLLVSLDQSPGLGTSGTAWGRQFYRG